MMTQLRNRCLEIETLTSGNGVMIPTKDLNATLQDLCRNIIKYNEIEMRTRCSDLSVIIVQYENLLYTKDQ